ncbi:hypothetical protein [Microlunatus ginsengisoli]|uniref:Uncharacterized protein n=1 Tax=Microlunatus ginsengisoli TaxID=363863 RepID=A0ABP7ADF3_9ACTN
MAEIARIQWVSPGPREVDEELVVGGDGSARLLVRTSRDGSPAIGTWRTDTDPDERAELAGVQREIDLRHPALDPVAALAERVAARARQQPVAVATFYAAAVTGIGIGLQAVGAGEAAAEFQLDPGSVVVHVEDQDGTESRWYPAGPLEAGFVSSDPAVFGGVGTPAQVPPGTYGTIAVSCPELDDPATQPTVGAIAVEVTGRLRGALDEDEPYRRFVVRTAAVPFRG